jgi:hypothetical protein
MRFSIGMPQPLESINNGQIFRIHIVWLATTGGEQSEATDFSVLLLHRSVAIHNYDQSAEFFFTESAFWDKF